MRNRRVALHRYISWILALAAFSTVITGYSLSRGWYPNQYLLSSIHRIFEISFLALLILHVAIALRYSSFNLMETVDRIWSGKRPSVHALRLLQRTTSWLIILFAIMMVIPGLNGYELFARNLEDIIPFGLHRIFDFFLIVSITLHVAVGMRFLLMRRRIQSPSSKMLIVVFTSFILLSAASLEAMSLIANSQTPIIPDSRNPIPVEYNVNAYVRIAATTYGYDSRHVETLRPDIFRPGSFSVFDIIVHVSERESLDLEYHFDETMDTHVIDSLRGASNWWHEVIYSGGWRESNVFRIDHHPWKPDTRVSMNIESGDLIENIHHTFKEEVDRKNTNNGQVVIPQVFIDDGLDFSEVFTDVVVTPHNLRNDTFQDGVITALDIILSLGDQGIITYDLEWIESVGDADVVKSYWVSAINGRASFGTCGWVYETGAWDYTDFLGNHIHIPSDFRVLTSPDYSMWWWICL
ncbi:MAG: hypothetical protein ACXADC_05185 [Candidatus Thorarchaeota archaeon]|jgi:succinate dehydrogenase/fumarate reductase cytochrome b subunit